MSLVDPYHDRVFRNGRLYGVNYNEMTNQPSYTDISPFSTGRKAGEGIGLEPDVVIYMGKAAQGMPQDEGMDRRIAEGMMNAIGKAVFGADLDGGDARTLEYVPERDSADPRTLEYVPGRDDSEVIQLLASAEHPKFRAGPYSQLGPRPKGLRAIGPDALNSLPNSDIAKDKYMKIRNAIDLPKF